MARQLLLQTEVLKLCRENEGRFKNHRIIVSEGVYKLGNVVPRKGSTVDLRTNGQAITYELYDEQNRNLTDVSYEFAAYLADQLPFFEKIILDYDTIEPNPSSEPWSKVNTQIVVTMPEVDKEYKFIGAPSYTLFTAFNNNLLSGTDLVEVTLDTVKDITFEPTTPHKAGPQYFASDFVGSRFASNIAVKINELHPSIRKKAAGGIQDYIATYKDDLRDINVVEAFRSGLPVFCRDIPVFREVGEKFATFFSGRSPESFLRQFEEWDLSLKREADPKSESDESICWKKATKDLEKIINE